MVYSSSLNDSTYACVSPREDRGLPRCPHSFTAWFLMIMLTLRSPSLGCFAVGCLCWCCQERFLALEGTSWLPSAMESAQPVPTPLVGHVVNPGYGAHGVWRCLILPTFLPPALTSVRCQSLACLQFGCYCSTVSASGTSEA